MEGKEREKEGELKFVQLDPRKSREENPCYDIGIEITEAGLQIEGVPNLDHHGKGATSRTSSACLQAYYSIALAMKMAEKIRNGETVTMATIRPDADSVTAMAMLRMRIQMENLGKARGPNERILDAIDALDRKGPQAMVEYEDLYKETVAIAKKSADFKIPLGQRVEFVQSILDGTVDETEVDRLVAEHKKEFGEARKALSVSVTTDGRIAIITGSHGFAMNLGYEKANIVVATNEQMPVMARDEKTGQMKASGEKYVKHTVARRNQFVPVDLAGALAELQKMEPGWGGRDDIFGSPQNRNSCLTTKQVVEIVKKALR